MRGRSLFRFLAGLLIGAKPRKGRSMKKLLLALYVLGLGTTFVPDALAACCTSGDNKKTCCGPCCGAGPETCMADDCSGS